MLAADKLQPGSKVAGQAYFITNDEPRPFWRFTGDIVAGLGYTRPYRKISPALLYAVALLVELVLWLLRPLGISFNVDLTRFRILVSTRNRHFSCAKAKRDLGYKPTVSVDEGLRRTLAHFAHLRNPAAASDGRKAK